MDRGASAAFLVELLKSTSSPCHLVEVHFDDGTIYMTDAWRSVVWGGNTYVANGHFLNFSGLSETAELQVHTLNLSVSAVDQTWIAAALTKPYINRRVAIYKAFLDYTQSVVTLPIEIWRGGMDGMQIVDAPDGKCAVAISATGQHGDFDRRAGRHTNPSEHKIFFPGDTFFDRCAQLNKVIKWGAA